MKIAAFPMTTTDWAGVTVTEHPGETGVARWRTQYVGDVRVRMVEYSPGYTSNHWCAKGHIVLCVEGEFEAKVRDGNSLRLKSGMSYMVGDGDPPHQVVTKTGAMLFVVD
jgi:hypothetical protein